MTNAERTEKIRDYFKKEYDFELMPSQVVHITAQLDEVQSEAESKGQTAEYEKGISVGLLEASEIAQEMYLYTGVDIAQRLRTEASK